MNRISLVITLLAMPLLSQDWPRWKVLTPANTDQECIDTATFETLRPGHYKFWISLFSEGTTKKIMLEVLNDKVRFASIENSPFMQIEPGSIYEDFLTEARNLEKTFPLETTDILHIEGPRPYISGSEWIEGSINPDHCNFIKFFSKGGKDYLYEIMAPTKNSNMEIYNLKLFEYTKTSIKLVYLRARLKMFSKDTESFELQNQPASPDLTKSIRNNFADNEYVVGKLPIVFATPKGKTKSNLKKPHTAG